MVNRIRAVIFDWAGTTIDYGCFAPVQAFQEAFEKMGVSITMEEIRAPMGLLKRDHIRMILGMPRVNREWVESFGREPNEEDVNKLYQTFEWKLMASLQQYTDPIPGVLDLVSRLRKDGIKIGSTTGYTKEMMNVVVPSAKSKGYAPDFVVSSDEVKAGRPSPYMIFRNLIELDAYPPRSVIKVGDTVSDVQEGKNAGVWSIGVIRGGSELGLSQKEVESTPQLALRERMDLARRKFEQAGADFVMESIDHLPAVIERIQQRMREDGTDGTIL